MKIASYETILLAKEKGFDECTEQFYTNSRKPILCKGLEYMSECYVREWKWNSMPGNYPTRAEDVLCAAPYLYEIVEWLREEKGIAISIEYWQIPKSWAVTVVEMGLEYEYKFSDKVHDQSLEAGVNKALELIDTK